MNLDKCACCTGMWDDLEKGCSCRYGGNPETCEGPKEEVKHHQKRVIKPQYKLINDHFQNYKSYGIPKAQLVIADIPFNLGKNAYGSNPSWYIDGDNKNGESKLANKEFFDTDKDFRIPEFFHFCNKLVKPEPKETGKAGCMIVFCAFEQQFLLIEEAKKYNFPNYIPLSFYKNYSPQVLKANMRVVGNTEYALLFYRDKLPKFNNNGRMIFNSIPYERDTVTPKIHPCQKGLGLLKYLITIFTDKGDVVIDPCAGSGSTLLASEQLGRKSFGFEIKKEFIRDFNNIISKNVELELMF
jgi:site-specific DNA-methyltransferase (adenine-specific)